VLWTHGIARQELYGGKRGPASWGRWTQLSLADGIVCYDAHMAEIMARRFPDKVVGAAPNSTDGSAMVAERRRCEREGRAAVRRGLGLPARFYLAGLGRLVGEKDFGRLIRVGAALRRDGMDLGIILIGGGPEAVVLRREAEALGLRPGQDIVFTGGVSDGATLARWLYASDACVSPGFLGLSVVDCLFAGIPVISFEPSSGGPHHSPEWRYLRSGVTGFFAAKHSDDALAAACRDYLEQPDASRERTRSACSEYASANLGVSRMADGMLDMIRDLRRPGRT
jgi:glycosyltransferase involved in cell wall biosynthesis